jgi:hypothetical protein
MKRAGTIAVAVLAAAVVVGGGTAVVAVAMLPAERSGPVSDVASISIRPTASPRPTTVPGGHSGTGPAVPVIPAGPAVVVPEPEHTEGQDDGAHSGKGKSGGG